MLVGPVPVDEVVAQCYNCTHEARHTYFKVLQFGVGERYFCLNQARFLITGTFIIDSAENEYECRGIKNRTSTIPNLEFLLKNYTAGYDLHKLVNYLDQFQIGFGTCVYFTIG
jgi:hypothetical protein